MKKEIIGLKLQFLIPALIFSVIGAAAIFLPYVHMGENTYLAFGLAKDVLGSGQTLFGVIMVLAMAATILGLVCGIVLFVKPSVAVGRIWMGISVIPTVCYTVLLFASKMGFDKSGVLSGSFLVKNFGIGFWLSLAVAYITLVFTMKIVKVNTGYIVLVILSIIWLFPVLWIVLTSFREESGYYVGYFFPKGLSFKNYINLFDSTGNIHFAKWWLNTLLVAVCSCVLCTLIILGTAFTLSRTRFRGRKLFMQAVLIIGMFPGFMSMIAVYNILKGIGLAQTLVALIVVSAAGAAMGYYICKGFFDTIPKALDEAAIIDGATRWQIFTRITIPLSKPIIIYTVMTSFLGAWSDYIFPSMVLGDNTNLYTVAIGLYWMRDWRRIDTYYTQFAAGAVLVALPIVLLFIWLQKYYVEGLSGSVKG